MMTEYAHLIFMPLFHTVVSWITNRKQMWISKEAFQSGKEQCPLWESVTAFGVNFWLCNFVDNVQAQKSFVTQK